MTNLRQFLQSFLQRSVTALLPCSCALCQSQSDEIVCHACHAAYFSSQPARCTQCAQLMPPDAKTTHCGDCLQNPPAFDQTVVVCDYAAPMDQLVLALKFGHQPGLAPWFARMQRDAILRDAGHTLPQILCAVPLSQARLQERGFNQAHEISRYLSPHLGIPYRTRALQRVRNTLQQSGLKPHDRMTNIRNAFTPAADFVPDIRNAHIGVVDDVITTGLTLHEIATMLKRFGARQVTNYVFARTPSHFM